MSTLTFSEFVHKDYWPVARLELAPGTRAQQEYVLRDLVAAFGPRPLAEVTARECAAWWAQYAARVAPATANHRLVRLRHIFKTARAWGLLETDPTAALKRRPARGRERRLQAWEREALLAAAGDHLRGYILGALYTGMRRESLWRLRERDLSLAEGILECRRTKNGDPLRLPAHSRLREYLEGRLTGNPEAPLFHPYRHPHEITQAFRRLCRRLGIQNLHFHDLRHEVGSRLGDAFANQSLIMRVLGHRDIRSSARYVHLSTEAVREAIEGAL